MAPTVTDIVTEAPIHVTPEETIKNVARFMRENAVKRLPVVTNGRPVGIVSLSDLAADGDLRSVPAEIGSAPPDNPTTEKTA